MIVFPGAEFTQVWAAQRGARARPEEGAIRTHDKADDRAEKAKEKEQTPASLEADGGPSPE